MSDWIREQGFLFAIFLVWIIGFYASVIGLAFFFRTFWKAKWSDRRKAATVVVTIVALVPAVAIASKTGWIILLVFAVSSYTCWQHARDEREFRD